MFFWYGLGGALAILCMRMNQKGSSVQSIIAEQVMRYYQGWEQIYQMDNHSSQAEMTHTAQPKHPEEVKEEKVEEEKQEEVVKAEEKVEEVKQKEPVAEVEKKEEAKQVIGPESQQAEPVHKVQEKPVSPPPVEKTVVEEDLGEYIQHFKTTKGYTQIQQHCKKITELVALTSKHAQTLSLSLGVGESKGKTVLKYGVSFTNKVESNFGITIQVRLKKKTELHALLQGELKRWQKTEGYHPYKLCQVSFTETDKSLKIHIVSPIFEEHILNDTIDSITKAQEPALKVAGELTIKNSIRSDEASLQKKQLVKWIAQGLAGSLQVTGSHAVINHFISPLIDIFPVFKVVRSGEVSLKLRSPGSVDKLFEKLGIAEASEQTPSLSAFLAQSLKEYLDSSAFPVVADLMRQSLHFCSSQPNDRAHLELSANLAQLRLDLSFSADPCKQLGELTALSEVFT